MQPHTPKGEGPQRERPLQKSMFLPEYQPSPIIQSRPQALQNMHYNPLKRSSMPVLQGIHQSNLSPSYHSHNMNYSQTIYPTGNNNNIPLQFSEGRAQSQHQILLPTAINTIKSPNNIIQSNQMEIRGFAKFQKSMGFDGKSPAYSIAETTQSQQFINTILDQLKQKYIPSLLKNIKKQLSDEISSLKSQLNNLKVEMKAQTQKQQLFNNDIRSQAGNIINFNTNNINNINKIKREENDFEKELCQLERKYNQIQVKLSQNLTSLYNQFQKITQKLDRQAKQKGFKISQVKSSLSPIMLEYKESFLVKRGQIMQRGHGQQQIVLGTCCYYIDRNGYLLDSQNKYLTDLRGHQIRLEEKHLKLLQHYKILHR